VLNDFIPYKPIGQLIRSPTTNSRTAPVTAASVGLCQAHRAIVAPRTYLQVHLRNPTQANGQCGAHEVLECQCEAVLVQAKVRVRLALSQSAHGEVGELLEGLVHEFGGVLGADNSQVLVRELAHVLDGVASRRADLLLDDGGAEPEANVDYGVEDCVRDFQGKSVRIGVCEARFY